MIDLHVHTNHSHDSKATIREQCEKAVRIGLQYLCFTDHINMNKADPGYGLYDAEKFFGEFNEAKESIPAEIKLLAGQSFRAHIYTEEFGDTSCPAISIGSVHTDQRMRGELVSIGCPRKMHKVKKFIKPPRTGSILCAYRFPPRVLKMRLAEGADIQHFRRDGKNDMVEITTVAAQGLPRRC